MDNRDFAFLLPRLHWLNIVGLSAVIFVARLGELAHAQATFAQLEQTPQGERAKFIADALIASAEATKKLVFDLEIEISGTQAEIQMGEEERFPDGPNGKGRMVTSLKKGFATTDTNPKYRCQYLFDGTYSKTIMSEKNRIIQVSVDCKPGYLIDEFQNFCRITGASCWRDSTKRLCTTEPWAAHIGGMEFDEFRTIENLGRVAVLVSKNIGKPQVGNWYFGALENQIVWVGNEMASDSHRAATGAWGEHIDRYVSSVRCDYKRVVGHAIPSRWTVSIVSETLKPDRSPMTPPRVVRTSVLKVKSCKVLPQFPESILNIAIPSDAKIFDNCADQQQRAIAEEVVQSQTNWKWWILAAGIGLCASAIATWRYVRK